MQKALGTTQQQHKNNTKHRYHHHKTGLVVLACESRGCFECCGIPSDLENSKAYEWRVGELVHIYRLQVGRLGRGTHRTCLKPFVYPRLISYPQA